MPGDFPYDPKYQFPRNAIRDAICHWANSNASASYPVANLVGPPGCGKSWVLRDLSDFLTQQAAIVVFLIHVPEIIDPKSPHHHPAFHYPEINACLFQCYRNLQARFSEAPEYDPNLNVSQALAVLISWRHPPVKPPRIVALVDGYDEISDAHQDFLASRVLVPLVTGGNQVRMVIAHRNPSGVRHDTLRSMQKRVFDLEKIDPLNDAYGQFEKLRSAMYAQIAVSSEDFRVWSGHLKTYRWNNPYINRYLFESALTSCTGPLPQLTPRDLRNCVHALLERPDRGSTRYPLLSDQPGLLLLLKIATLGKEFTADDLATNVGITWLNPLILLLINVYGVLLPIKGTLRYALVEPLRSLLLDLETLEKEPDHE